MDHVDYTLQQWRRSRFIWGESDCMISVSDYWRGISNVDVAGPFRGTYSDEAGAYAIVDAYGGMEGLMSLFELPRAAAAKRGDIILLDTADGWLASICTGTGAAARRQRGVLEVPLRRIEHKIWSVPECLLLAHSLAQLQPV